MKETVIQAVLNGMRAVLTDNQLELLERIRKAVEKEKYKFLCGSVKYRIPKFIFVLYLIYIKRINIIDLDDLNIIYKNKKFYIVDIDLILIQ